MCRTSLWAFFALVAVGGSSAQQLPGTIPGQAAPSTPSGYRIVSPANQLVITPGVVELMDLESRFEQAVATGGGKVFSQWFADDAVVLNNGKPAILGRGAIAAQAQWDPKSYQLTWTPQGAQMGPSSDMGFTWGHYDGKSINPDGHPSVTSGRYFTVWRKGKDGWKVVMDASASEPPDAGECCTPPKP